MISFVICVECVGVKYTMLVGIIIEIPFAIGELLLGLEAYFLRDFFPLQLVKIFRMLKLHLQLRLQLQFLLLLHFHVQQLLVKLLQLPLQFWKKFVNKHKFNLQTIFISIDSITEQKALVQQTTRCQFHQHFLRSFSYESLFWQLFLVTFWLWQKIRTKNAHL